jgi:hypothetical protein
MFHLAQVFQFIVDRLDDSAFAEQYLVRQAHDMTLAKV